MKRVAIALLSLALAVVAAVLIWMLRSAHRPQDALAARPEPPEAPLQPPLPAPMPSRSDGGIAAAAPPPEPAEPPKPDPHGAARPLAETLLEARAHLLRAARACPPPRRGLDARQRIVFWFELVTERDQAHVEEVELIDSDIGDAPLAQCVLDRVGAARWPLPGAAVARRKLQESFNVAELGP